MDFDITNQRDTDFYYHVDIRIYLKLANQTRKYVLITLLQVEFIHSIPIVHK